MDTMWIWLIIGAFLILSEFVIPGFIIFFFGLGAIITAILKMIIPEIGLEFQLLTFCLSSLISLIVFRRFMPKVFRGVEQRRELPEDACEYANEKALVVQDITPEVAGKIYFHGSVWNATSAESHISGAQVSIIKRNNITFIVK